MRESTFRRDNEFWDIVQLAMNSILRLMGAPDQRYITQAWWPNSERVVAMPSRPIQPLETIYGFFASSPDRFVPVGNVLIDVRNTVPVSFKKRELLLFLWNCAGGSANKKVTGICQYLDKIFWAEDAPERPEDAAEWFKNHPEEIRRAKVDLRELYEHWFQYVKRHYNRELKGKDDLSKWRFQISLIEGKRNQELGDTGPTLAEAFGSLQLVDDTLCYIAPQQERDRGYTGMSVTADFLRAEMKWYKFPEKYFWEIKKLLRLHQKILCRANRRFSQANDEIPYFSYLWNKTAYHVFYDREAQRFRCKTTSQSGRMPVMKQIYVQDFAAASVPKHYLYELTGGDWDSLCSLAKISCYAVSAQKLFPGVVVTDRNSIPDLGVLLEKISGRSTPDIWTLRTLSKVEVKDLLIGMKIDGQTVGVCMDKNERMNPEQWMRLRKIVNGSQIIYKDPILMRKKHRNVMQWIIIGDDLTFTSLKSHGIAVLRAPKCNQPQNFGEEDVLWLQLILPLWGLLLLKEKPKKKAPADTVMPAVQSFMECCCRLLPEDGEFLPARELYEAYVDFGQKSQRNDILKFKDFNDVMEKEYGQRRVRWHKTTGENKTGYRRIRLLDHSVNENMGQQPKMEKREQFFAQLEQITKDVMSRFEEWPFKIDF